MTPREQCADDDCRQGVAVCLEHAVEPFGLIAPPTRAQREWIRGAVREGLVDQMRPLLAAWDARSADMLAVLAESGDTRVQVRSAARTIKVAGWLGVGAMVAGILGMWVVLERERADLRVYREVEAMRRLEAAQMVISAGREDVRRLDELVRMGCPKPAQGR